MVGHKYKLECALYPNFIIIYFQATVRAIGSFVYTISVGMIGLHKPKQTEVTEGGSGRYFFLLVFS